MSELQTLGYDSFYIWICGFITLLVGESTSPLTYSSTCLTLTYTFTHTSAKILNLWNITHMVCRSVGHLTSTQLSGQASILRLLEHLSLMVSESFCSYVDADTSSLSYWNICRWLVQLLKVKQHIPIMLNLLNMHITWKFHVTTIFVIVNMCRYVHGLSP